MLAVMQAASASISSTSASSGSGDLSSTIWRVLIVEDDPDTRAFFVQSVRQCAQLALSGEAASVAQGKALLESLQQAGEPPHVLLTDLGLPDGSGLALIHWVAQHLPGCESLVISMFGDEDNVLASIEAGATGYIHKDSAPADIAQSILQLKSGASPISPMIARRLLAQYRQLSGQRAAPASASELHLDQKNQENRPLVGVNIDGIAIKNIANEIESKTIPNQLPADVRMLSARETEILEHIARGFSYAEVARLKHVSVHTIQTHIKNIYSKLSVHNRSEAVFEATRLGMLKL
jgi:DNA-binding NarL/FixJ family response regulator